MATWDTTSWYGAQTSVSPSGIPMDFTELSCYQQCPKRWELRFSQGLQKIREDERELPRHFGQAIHEGLAAYYLGGDLETMTKAFLSAFVLPDEAMRENIRTVENGMRLLQEYCRFAAQNDRDWNIREVEQPGSFQWKTVEVPWEVKPDLVVETPSGIYGVNHKTTAKPLLDSYWRPYGLDGWITGCTAYLADKYHQCSGVIINVIRLSYRERPELFEVGQLNSAKQEYANVEVKFSKSYRKEMVYAWGFTCQFQRQVFNRTKQQVEEWKHDIEKWVKVFNRANALGEFPRNTTQCHFCEFAELCEACGDQQIQEVLYEHCDPYEYLHKKSTLVNTPVGRGKEEGHG